MYEIIEKISVWDDRKDVYEIIKKWDDRKDVCVASTKRKFHAFHHSWCYPIFSDFYEEKYYDNNHL